MASLKGLLESANRGDDLVVTGPHSQWLELLEFERTPNRKALIHAVNVYLGNYKHERSGRFSPSAMGECPRRLLFGFAGAPQLPPNIDNQEMMDHGTEAHLKWQLEGLTQGYMTDAEVWVHNEGLLCGGSMDALLIDDSILELKTAGMFIYNKIVLQQKWPKWENLLQLATYFLLADKNWASIVYEDRSGGNFYEFRIERDSKIEQEVLRRLASYKRYVEADELPPELDMCVQRMGSVYQRCPYRKICPKMNSVSSAQDLQVTPDQGRIVPDTHTLWVSSVLDFIQEMPDDGS